MHILLSARYCTVYSRWEHLQHVDWKALINQPGDVEMEWLASTGTDPDTSDPAASLSAVWLKANAKYLVAELCYFQE